MTVIPLSTGVCSTNDMATTYTLTPSPTVVTEGNQVTFTISRSGDTPSETIYFSAVAGTASYSAGDYTRSEERRAGNDVVSRACAGPYRTTTRKDNEER